MSTAWIGFGSNVGDSRQIFDRAGRRLKGGGAVLSLRSSSLFRTTAVGPDQPDFLNAVIAVETDWPPLELFAELQAIEFELGRDRILKGRVSERWGPRTIDLDLEFFDNLVLEASPRHGESWSSSGLAVPHPRAHWRLFVLEPMVDLAADFRHPQLGRTVRELRDALVSPQAHIVRISQTGDGVGTNEYRATGSSGSLGWTATDCHMRQDHLELITSGPDVVGVAFSTEAWERLAHLDPAVTWAYCGPDVLGSRGIERAAVLPHLPQAVTWGEARRLWDQARQPIERI